MSRVVRLVAQEAWLNLAGHVGLAVTMALAVGIATTVGLLPEIVSDAGAVRTARAFVRRGGLTFEQHAGPTSIKPLVPSAVCDGGWLNSQGAISWAGGVSIARQIRPRGELTLPVSAYRASRGLLRHISPRPLRADEALVGEAYAAESGLRTGSIIEAGEQRWGAVVFLAPQDLPALDRSVVLPAIDPQISTCYVRIDARRWNSSDQVLDMTRPLDMQDWTRQCVGCDGQSIADAAATAARTRRSWVLGPVLAGLLALLYLRLRRADFGLYRAIAFGTLELACLSLIEATIIVIASATIALAAVVAISGADLGLLTGFRSLYVWQGITTIGAFVVGCGLMSRSINGRKIYRALRE